MVWPFGKFDSNYRISFVFGIFDSFLGLGKVFPIYTVFLTHRSHFYFRTWGSGVCPQSRTLALILSAILKIDPTFAGFSTPANRNITLTFGRAMSHIAFSFPCVLVPQVLEQCRLCFRLFYTGLSVISTCLFKTIPKGP